MRAKRPTLADVAARAGVSRALASLVIRDAPGPSEASRALVRRAAADLGYRPDPAAQALRSHRSRLLGVLFRPQEPFHADLLETVYPAATELGYDVVLGAVVAARDEAVAVESLLGSRCEAVILLGSDAGRSRLAALGRQVPVVVVGDPATPGPLDAVRTDEVAGVRLAVDHLVGLGHREIVFIDSGRHPTAADRRWGYRAAMRRHAGQVAGMGAERVLTGDHTELAGVAAAEALLTGATQGHRLPTAVLASNDRCAVGVLDTLRASGVAVPGRVSVAGYDDSRLSRLTHRDLTTVRQDAEQLARLAVRTATERLDGDRNDPRHLTVTPRLVPRGTTGPPPTHPTP